MEEEMKPEAMNLQFYPELAHCRCRRDLTGVDIQATSPTTHCLPDAGPKHPQIRLRSSLLDQNNLMIQVSSGSHVIYQRPLNPFWTCQIPIFHSSFLLPILQQFIICCQRRGRKHPQVNLKNLSQMKQKFYSKGKLLKMPKIFQPTSSIMVIIYIGIQSDPIAFWYI